MIVPMFQISNLLEAVSDCGETDEQVDNCLACGCRRSFIGPEIFVVAISGNIHCVTQSIILPGKIIQDHLFKRRREEKEEVVQSFHSKLCS